MTRQAAALVVGASGGLGGALLAELAADQSHGLLIGTAHRGSVASTRNCIPLQLDLTDPVSLQDFSKTVQGTLSQADAQLTTIVICSGLLHEQDIHPERQAEKIDGHSYLRLMQVNALGPLQLAASLQQLLPRRQPSRLVALSARVGSIADNRLGGWYSYRCSKAALNMGFKCLAVEFARSHPHCVLTLFHPGTVATALSDPYCSGLPAARVFSPALAAQQLWQVVQRRTEPGGALFVDWAGRSIEF